MASTESPDASTPDTSTASTPSELALPNGDADTRGPRYYWEEEDKATYCAQRALAYEAEGFLANELNFGARLLLGVQPVYDELPNVRNLPAQDTVEEAYTDRIAAILQVAAWHGLDVDELAHRGLELQKGLAQDSASSAMRRSQGNRASD